MLTAGSLFSGIAAPELAFERCGITTLWASEIDPQAASVHARHFPRTYQLGDIRHVGKHNAAPVDIVVGGSPCQDLSVAGNRAGLAGARSGLFHEYIRVIRELRPTFAIWENVPGALTSHNGRDFALVLRAFQECGALDIAYRVLDAQYFGLAQRRKRVFLVADFRGHRAGTILFEPESVRGYRTTRKEAGADISFTLTGSNQRLDASNNETFIGVTALNARNMQISDRIAGTLQDGSTLNAMPLLTGTLRANGSGLQYASTNIPGDYLVPEKAFSLRSKSGLNGGLNVQNSTIVPALAGTMAASGAGTARPAGQKNELDFLIGEMSHGTTNQTNAGEILRILRDKTGTEAFSEWGIAVITALQKAEVLQSGMHGKSLRRKTSQRKSGVDDRSSSRSQACAARFMSEVWSDECQRRASQRWGLDEQQSRQLGTYLSQLSQSGASCAENLHDLWKASEGIGILRQALSEIQEVWRPTADKNQSIDPTTYRVRRLMPIEAERLMGFPDNWTRWNESGAELADTPRYRMLGNSIAVPVMEWIARRMVEVLT